MTLVIRNARPGDAGLVLSFIRELAAYEKLLHEVAAQESDLDSALFGAVPRVFCLIAEWDGKPAGFALWFYSFSTFLSRHGIFLEDLFVRPEYRGNGIAGALMAHLAARCVDEDLGRFEWNVLDWNEPAIKFYRSIGAEPLGEWTMQRVSGEALKKLAAR